MHARPSGVFQFSRYWEIHWSSLLLVVSLLLSHSLLCNQYIAILFGESEHHGTRRDLEKISGFKCALHKSLHGEFSLRFGR